MQASVHGPGVRLNEKGYLRYSAGPNRDRYVHRVVMSRLCTEFCYYPLDQTTPLGRPTGLPWGFTVEHLDHNRTHNCPGNLLLLQTEIHNHLSWCSWLNKPLIGDVPGQETPLLGPDDIPANRRGIYTEEELGEVPF